MVPAFPRSAREHNRRRRTMRGMKALLIRAAVVCACVAVVGAEQQPEPVAPAQPPPQVPVFRAGIKVVRVDATVTASGDRPVSDLTAADFELSEDGVPQRIDQVQFIRLTGRRAPGDDTSLEIRSQDHAEAEAARDDVRVFAIFLDDYHVDKAPDVTLPLRSGLTAFIRQLWPTDLVAVMDPLTPLSALRFTRSQAELLRRVQEFEGRQGELYPIKSMMEEAQWSSGNVRRIRAEVTLSALTALTVKLGGLREGRKSILFVSQGPPTFFGTRDVNLQNYMREITAAANRGNVAIYALDPRTLGNEARLGARDTLFQLAGETGGRAIVNTNNFAAGLSRLLTETSAYYVLGYTPTRAEDDGKFHKINVKVKRSGTHVLARQGYWAPSSREIEAAAAVANRVLEPKVAQALDTAATTAPTRRDATVWVGQSRAADGRTAIEVAWEPSNSGSRGTIGALDVTVLADAGDDPILSIPAVPPTTVGKVEKAAERFPLEPGPHKIRFLAKSPTGEVVDDWTQPLAVLDFRSAPVSVSTPRFFVARTLMEWRALQAESAPRPSAARQFRRTTRVAVSAEVFSSTAPPMVTAHLLTREGKELTALPVPDVVNGHVRFELPVGSLGQGTYLLRVTARAAGQSAAQVSLFRIVP
jgi:VWFA-related protein